MKNSKINTQHTKFDDNDISSITVSHFNDSISNFKGVFKIYKNYLFSNIFLIIALLSLPMAVAFLFYSLTPATYVITQPFFSLFFLSFIFLPLIIIDFRNSTIIKRIGSTNITRYEFIIYLTFINVIISFIFFFFILLVLFPIFNLFFGAVPGSRLLISTSAAAQSWKMWTEINYVQLIFLVIIFSILGSQLGIFLGMTLTNKTIALLIGFSISILFLFMSGLWFFAWVPAIASESKILSFSSWIYALTPFTLVGNTAIASIYGLVGWITFLISMFVGIVFSLLFIYSSKWWFSFSSIR